MSEDIWKMVCKACGEDKPEHKRGCVHGGEVVISHHTGCGGEIVSKGQCTWCKKCGQYFCGCGAGG